MEPLMYLLLNLLIEPVAACLNIGGPLQILGDLDHPLNRKFRETPLEYLLNYVAIEDSRALVNLGISHENLLQILSLNRYRAINYSLL
jgi:hypothetical protein